MKQSVSNKDLRMQLDEFNELCRLIETSTYVKKDTDENTKQKRIKRLLNNYEEFFEYYFPHLAKSKCAKFQVTAVNLVAKNQFYAGVEEWARGHAKSVHFDLGCPMWLKAKGEMKVMILVGKSEDAAKDLLSDLQAELMSNQRYIHDFGEQVSFGDWKDGKFGTKDGCGFFALGRGQSPRGKRKREHRPDYIVCDDLDDDELCENPKRVRKVVEWVKEALYGTMAAGRGRLLIVGNRIHKEGIIAQFAENKEFHHSVVNALDKNGEPTWKENYTKADFDRVLKIQGYRSFQKEYMNNPIVEGTVFKNKWINYKPARPLKEYSAIVAYCDPSFKGSSTSDYKAIPVIGKWKNEYHILKVFVRQCSISEMVRWFYDTFYDFTFNYNVVLQCWMEAIFVQDLLFEDFKKEGETRGFQLPLRKDMRSKPDKFQRIESISPYFERGEYYIAEEIKSDADTIRAVEQLLSVEKGSRTADDFPDALEGGTFHLMRQTLDSANDKAEFIQKNRNNKSY
jgi:hypothetical protein